VPKEKGKVGRKACTIKNYTRQVCEFFDVKLIKLAKNMQPKIIFQDSELLVIEKPAGWITNEADTTRDVPVLQKWLKENLNYEIAQSKELRSGIVHRLDKDTSGILLVAKNEEFMNYLQAQFKERKVEKSYTALLHGKLEPKNGNIDAPVGRLPWNRERFGVLPGGRAAQTEYIVQAYYQKGKDVFSLVRFFPKTGRTHQLRIHAKHIGHPIVSDNFYAGRKTARNDKKWCSRLFLHAGNISFTKPNGGRVEFESKISKDLLSAIDNLQKV